jgi:anthranilate synthase component 1
MVNLKEDGRLKIRPLAGTRKRGKTEQQDKELEQELLADEKELAEHLMLLDLGRNDIGRVANFGSVRVTEQMKVERYSHVMHIVSDIEGMLKQGMDEVDVLIAAFPAGTVSGAPKIKAMEIIAKLEDFSRSFYAGTMGYLTAGKGLDTCIMLRTCLIKNGHIIAQAGGGIVADSDPDLEYQETQNKANAIIKAVKNIARHKITGHK